MYEVKQYIKEEAKTPSKKVKILKGTVFFLLLIFAINLFINVYFYRSSVKDPLFVSPLAVEVVHQATTFINSQQNSKELEKIVTNVLKDNSNNFGVVIINLGSGERYYLNEDKVFDAASLYKLWVMVVSYQKIEEGKLRQTDILSDDVASLNEKFNISSDSAELTEGKISWPVQNALEKMIIISDNYSALLLTEKIGLSSVSNFLQKYNFSDSKVGTLNKNPSTSALDTANFFKQLHNGQFANITYTDKMLELLKSQRINTKLSKNLPKDTVIAHKTGELDGFSHDGGIVYSPKGDYIIVVMSKTSDMEEANGKIALISEQVYNYFSKQ